ncbi:hypothetical protein ACWD7T_33185 [Streptomyces sp. 900116325]
MITLAATLLAALPARGLAGFLDDDGVIVHPQAVPSADARKGVHVLIGSYAAMDERAPEYAVLCATAYRHDGGIDFEALGDVYDGSGDALLTAEVARAVEATAQWFAGRITVPVERARELNRAAFLEEDADTPAIRVAGVAVHAYVDPERGQLVVSVHLDTGDVASDLVSAAETVPLHVTVNGHQVFNGR